MTLAVALDPDDMRRRRARNWAVLIVLLGLSALFYAITIVKMTHSRMNHVAPCGAPSGPPSASRERGSGNRNLGAVRFMVVIVKGWTGLSFAADPAVSRVLLGHRL